MPDCRPRLMYGVDSIYQDINRVRSKSKKNVFSV